MGPTELEPKTPRVLTGAMVLLAVVQIAALIYWHRQGPDWVTQFQRKPWLLLMIGALVVYRLFQQMDRDDKD